jgi:hypothetical protein
MRVCVTLYSQHKNENPEILSETAQIVESLKMFAFDVEEDFLDDTDGGFYAVECEFDSTPEAWLVFRDTLEVFPGWSMEFTAKK